MEYLTTKTTLPTHKLHYSADKQSVFVIIFLMSALIQVSEQTYPLNYTLC